MDTTVYANLQTYVLDDEPEAKVSALRDFHRSACSQRSADMKARIKA